MTRCTSLDLSGTQLTEIASNTFATLTRVTSLKLDNVLLSTLNANSFAGLSMLPVRCGRAWRRAPFYPLVSAHPGHGMPAPRVLPLPCAHPCFLPRRRSR